MLTTLSMIAVLGVLIAATALTALRRLGAREKQLRLVVESIAAGIVTTDRDGHATMCNRAAAGMLGKPMEEMPRADIHALLHEPVPAAEDDCPITAAAKHGEARVSVRDLPGGRRLQYSAAPLSEGVVISLTDITDQRQAEQQIEQARRVDSLGRLAATMAHEYNNVLMGIQPFVDLIARSTKKATPAATVEMATTHIASAVQRGRRITQDILRFTRMAEPVRAPFVIREWMATLEQEAGALVGPGVHVSTTVTPPELSIEGDATQLRQVLANLILNARDAMPEGGSLTIDAVREPASARFAFGAVEHPERFAHIRVHDTGVGMSPEVMTRAFEPMFTTKRSGTGLGLAVVHQIVQSHNGRILIESPPEGGTTFHLFLPLAQTPPAPEGAVSTPPPKPTAPLQILLVEDDVSVADGIKSLLEMEGHRVAWAEGGQDALDQVQTKKFDVVVLDMGLPDMDGIRVLKTIASLRPQLPVIISTGHAARTDVAAAAFLQKPYEIADLLRVIRDVTA
jgi:PAS domain S-box-containing protein